MHWPFCQKLQLLVLKNCSVKREVHAEVFAPSVPEDGPLALPAPTMPFLVPRSALRACRVSLPLSAPPIANGYTPLAVVEWEEAEAWGRSLCGISEGLERETSLCPSPRRKAEPKMA
mmetsp:Transcript_116942/g.364070  ORF Transcript_116942/g.364070 Transcript_116942/m.364070 type:complete len:117 (-) Transcript_116942:12-362(-)